MKVEKFYVYNTDNEKLSLPAKETLEVFSSGPLPLIWIHKGMYGFVKKEIIANMIEDAENCIKQNKTQNVSRRLCFYWDNGTVHMMINPVVYKKLMGDNVDA